MRSTEHSAAGSVVEELEVDVVKVLEELEELVELEVNVDVVAVDVVDGGGASSVKTNVGRKSWLAALPIPLPPATVVQEPPSAGAQRCTRLFCSSATT
mmetsp:Transcript_109291/g.348862  ORF Transcript_109291/g.348862 Transcript_109291/m.348862 type:complete len:98 (+) Transcript_109291:1769-2062(+)